jgi:hypothetical protein
MMREYFMPQNLPDYTAARERLLMALERMKRNELPLADNIL